MIDAALEHAATMTMSGHFDTVCSDSVVNELQRNEMEEMAIEIFGQT